MLLCSRRFHRATFRSEKHHHLFHSLRLRTTWLHRHADATVFADPAHHAMLEWSWNARIRAAVRVVPRLPALVARDRHLTVEGRHRTTRHVRAGHRRQLVLWVPESASRSVGAQACEVEIDPQTGVTRVVSYIAVDDVGTVINPMLVDEQIRGGIVQGIGGAMFEECIYSDDGQLLNGSMADYLVPMAGEMPDMVIAHVQTPTKTSELGAKGVGEAGTAGAPGAVMNAINDALAPLNANVSVQPFTPQRILTALGKI